MAFGLISCASVRDRAERGGRDWGFTPASRDEPAKLVYGRPDSDDVDLLLWCDASKNKVLITPVGADDERFGHVALRSGGAQVELDLRQDDRLGSVGAVGLDSSLMSAFRNSGRLIVAADGKSRLHLDASPSKGLHHVQDFFRACR